MRTFRMTHLVFTEKSGEVFDEGTPPSWLTGKAFGWWYTDHVLKLEVGQKIQSDFREIERIA